MPAKPPLLRGLLMLAGACAGHTGDREGGLTLWLGLGHGRRQARGGDRNSL